MIANVRGTSGSGKSTLMVKVIDHFNLMPMPDPDGGKKYLGHTNPTYPSKITVVGDYRNICGGCDGITEKGRAQDIIQDRVRASAAFGDVLFEGLLISHIYGRYRDMALNEYPGQFVMVLMDTPLETCLLNVIQRREDSGRARGPFNPTNTIKMYEDVVRVAEKCKEDGVPFVWLDHTKAFDHLMRILGRDAPEYRYNSSARS